MRMLERSKDFWMKVCDTEPDGYISAGNRTQEYKDFIGFIFNAAKPENRIKRMLRSSVRSISVVSVLLASSALVACQTTKEIPVVQTRKLEIPDSLLHCKPEPKAIEKWKSQADFGRFAVVGFDAGADCRSKLGAVRKIVKSQ